MKPGDVITLNTPDNSRLHGLAATILKMEPWGAHVSTTAGSGCYRALHAEMTPVWPEASDTQQATRKEIARDQGYTGDVCECGGFRMRRSGACLVCEDCGRSSGCG